jgi:MgtE intracellular N domain
MRAKKNVDSVKLEFRNAVLTEARMANYLRSRQKKGAELKGEIMLAVSAFFSVYSIAEDPNSTEIEIERAFVKSLNSLSGQMSELEVYCRGRFNLSATTIWARFGELPSNVSPTFGSIIPAAIAHAIEPVPAAPPPKVKSVKEMSTEERNEYFVDMSEEERNDYFNGLPKEERDDYLRVLPIEERNDYLNTLSRDEVRAFFKTLPNDQLTIK